jgi:EAL domain-containing protein (putative c-di-GMP-specific phosphodiesterase class I)
VPDGQTASAGIAAWDPLESQVDLMSRVDSALYASKRSGRDAVSTADMAAGSTDHRNRTGQALTPRPVFQPIVELETGRIVAVEALSRFDDSVLPPDEVFARAWLRGHGPELEAAAIKAALQAGAQFGDLKIHINVSARGLVTPQIRQALPADLRSVVLEITEQDISSDSAGTEQMLDELRRRGATLAIDDFGVGFSNLRRMIGLRPEIIKLDRSLIIGIEHSPGIRAIVAAVAHQALLTGRVVCAEGVESRAELRALLGLGVRQGQGFLFSRAVPAAEAVRLMRLPTGLIPAGGRDGTGPFAPPGALTVSTTG